MKSFLKITLISLLFAVDIFSQRFGNEWINYSSSYIKIQVNTNGIYRIGYSELNGISQINLANLNPKNARLFHRGIEIPIKVLGENDNMWNNGDFIEFFGSANNGEQDKFMHDNPTQRLNPYYSLYSDVTNYFLEIDNTIPGKRIANAPNTSITLQNESYSVRIIQENFNTSWTHDPNWTDNSIPLKSNFEIHEGVGGARYRFDRTLASERVYKSNITLPNYYNGTTNQNDGIHVDIKAVFMNNAARRNVVGHIGGLPISENISGLVSRVFSKDIPALSTGNIISDSLTIVNTTSTRTVSSGNNGKNFDLFVISYQRTTYPSNFNFINNSSFLIVPNTTGYSKFIIPNVNETILAYDITDPYNPKQVTINKNGSDNEILIENDNTYRTIFTSLTPTQPPTISFKKFNNIQFSNFDYMIITHSKLEPGATDYVNYRNSSQGGGYKVFKIYVPDIYDEFGYGERNPYGIRRMVDYWVTNGNLKYMLLLGAGSNTPHTLRSHETTLDLVPSMGYPGADILFSDNMGGFPRHAPSIPTGRIHAKTSTDVINYLAKVMTHETQTSRPFQKKKIYISGAINQSEITQFNYLNTLNTLKTNAISSPFAAFADSSYVFSKTISDILPPNNPNRLPLPSLFFQELNKGVGMITYFGHGNSAFTAYDLTLASTNTNINNKGKYPFVYVNGCDVLNDFRGTSSISSNWLLTPDKGSVCFLGQAGPSWEFTDAPAMKMFFNTIFGSNIPFARENATNQMINSPIGNVVQQWMLNFEPQVININFEVTQDQTVLEGDPALRIFAPVNLALPVTLINYKSKKIDKDIVLNWSVSDEYNIKSYILEKSVNGKKFVEIARLNAINSKNEITVYNYIDTKPILNKVNYYKLTAYNSDNSIAFSKTIAEQIKSNDFNINVLENPINNNTITLNIDSQIKLNNLKVELINSKGIIIPFTFRMIEDKSIILSPKNNLGAGIYFVNISLNNVKEKTLKVIFQ